MKPKEQLLIAYQELIANEGKLKGYKNAFRLMGKEFLSEHVKNEKPFRSTDEMFNRILSKKS